jgi:hypothetical protein
MFRILSLVGPPLVLAHVTENFHIPLNRDSPSGPPYMSGHLFDYRDNHHQGTPIRVWFNSISYSWRNRVRESFLLFGEGNTPHRVVLDISDFAWSLVMNDFPHMYMSLSYGAIYTISVNSIAYRCTSEGQESLTLNPTDISAIAAFGDVSYTRIHENQYAFALTRASGEMNLPYQWSPLEFRFGEVTPSLITNESFSVLERIILTEGGSLINGPLGAEMPYIRLEACYDRLTQVFPNLEFILANENASDPSALTTQIVFSPEDYLTTTTETNVCVLQVDSVAYRGARLSLTDHLIRRISGIHFDFANSRVGCFDAL